MENGTDFPFFVGSGGRKRGGDGEWGRVCQDSFSLRKTKPCQGTQRDSLSMPPAAFKEILDASPVIMIKRN
jgi:hypothetical protein